MRHSEAWGLEKQRGESAMVRQRELEMVRVEGLRSHEEVAALVG